MTAKLRKIKRFTVYLGLMAIASALSVFTNQKNASESENQYSIIPSAPTAHADVFPSGDGSGGGLDTESTPDGGACGSGDACAGSACCDSDGGCDA